MLIKDRIMYLEGLPIRGGLAQLPIILMLCDAIGVWFITFRKGVLLQRVWHPQRNAYVLQRSEDKSVLSWAEMMFSL